MVAFGVESEETKELLRFVLETNGRLQDKNLVNNPFVGRIKILVPNTYVLDMTPIYPRLYLFGLITLFATIIFSRAWVWYIPSIVILSVGLLWSRYFFYLFFVLGSRKAGHKKKIKLLTGQETIRRFLDNK